MVMDLQVVRRVRLPTTTFLRSYRRARTRVTCPNWNRKRTLKATCTRYSRMQRRNLKIVVLTIRVQELVLFQCLFKATSALLETWVIPELFYIESLQRRNWPFNCRMTINLLGPMKEREFREAEVKSIDSLMKGNKLVRQESGRMNKGLALLSPDRWVTSKLRELASFQSLRFKTYKLKKQISSL